MTTGFYVKNPTKDFELEECESSEEAETVAQDLLEHLIKYAPEFGLQPDLDALEWGRLVPCGRAVQLGVEQWELRALPSPMVSDAEMRAMENIRVEASSEVHSRYAILLKARELEGAEDAAERVMARNDELEEFVGRFATMASRAVLQSEPTGESPPPWTPYRDEQKNGDYTEFAAFETWCERSCENFDLSIGDKIWLFGQFMKLAAKAEEMPNVHKALEGLPDKEPDETPGNDNWGPRFKTISPSEQIRRLRSELERFKKQEADRDDARRAENQMMHKGEFYSAEQHRRAMVQADDGDRARRANDLPAALRAFTAAAELEHQAYRELDETIQPSKKILLDSYNALCRNLYQVQAALNAASKQKDILDISGNNRDLIASGTRVLSADATEPQVDQ